MKILCGHVTILNGVDMKEKTKTASPKAAPTSSTKPATTTKKPTARTVEIVTSDGEIMEIAAPENTITEVPVQVVSNEAISTETPQTTGHGEGGRRGQYPKSISRIETKKHNAWYVRIYFQGAYVRKTFNDNIYGGKDVAFHEALQWRDEMEKRMGKPRTERSVRKKNLAEGRDAGIYRRNARHVKRGKVYFRDIYEVVWTPAPGKISRTTISVTKYGEEEALRKAREIRRQKEIELFGGPVY
jgi:hypothetical protein